MKISQKELKNIVKEVVKNKLDKDVEFLSEGSDFTAKRQIIQAAQTASMAFENELAKLLDLVPPDELQPVLQARYLNTAEAMKDKVVLAVSQAVSEFAKLPRNNRQKSTSKVRK